MTEASVKLELLSAHVPGEDTQRWPLTALNEDEPHIHGELRWTLAGRQVPGMGLWGPDDVCLGEWWDGVNATLTELAAEGAYTLDSCEQGSPAFLFERRGESILLSIVAGMGGGDPKPDWQQVPFAWDDWVKEVGAFKRRLREWIETKGPREIPAEWTARFSEPV
ncbi:hypothetical protein [Corallococcus sp. AB038B]|uniref:hypothetical protein n=1 Tax=Corallococcus sp. AB038B TaxID=2316718 RepID=UPI000EC6335F|nr:hypothetical protein [Corallococcus sp. AB038B]RKH97612.1 hypothetical protein D7Y04_26305 [Corallococcus sp. AB038B]